MHRHALRLLLLLAVAMLSACAPHRDDTGHFVTRSVVVDGSDSRYQVFVPAGARARAGQLPVVLFLHGSGERGTDGHRQTEAGLGPYLRRHADSFPALVVLPQVPDEQEWAGRNNAVALAALDAATAEFGGDRTRTSITGMSMGGYGAWNIALEHPTRFAAIVPVCGALSSPRPQRPDLFVAAVAGEADPWRAVAQRLRDVPIWMFHGARDDVVLPDDDRRLHAAFEAAGARDARYTEYPEGNHNAWDATYADQAMWEWMFAQQR